MILQQRGVGKTGRVSGFGWDEATQTYTDDDGSTYTVTDTSEGVIAVSTDSTDLPVAVVPEGTPLPSLSVDPGKLIRMGTDIYKYVAQTSASGQRIYVPKPYMKMPAPQQNVFTLMALAAAVFLLIS